MVPFLSNWYNW